MNILVDNKDLKSFYNIDVLDYRSAFSLPKIRDDQRVWSIKSGLDTNKENVRYDSKEFVLHCICKADNEIAAYNLAKTLIDYMFTKRVFVLSFRDSVKNIREAFLCERSTTIIPTIHVREQNGLYYFKLGLKDVNPNALIYHTSIVGNTASVDYTKGLVGDIYWGNGIRGEVSNSTTYEKSDYSDDGLIDIIIDIDKDLPDIPTLISEFSVDEVSGVKDFTVQFTDESIGDVVIWSWNFGDGNTSNEQNPEHTYQQSGTFTVTLQVFNSAQGSATEIKVDYITVRNARMLVNDAGEFALKNDAGDFGLIN